MLKLRSIEEREGRVGRSLCNTGSCELAPISLASVKLSGRNLTWSFPTFTFTTLTSLRQSNKLPAPKAWLRLPIVISYYPCVPF